MINLMVFNNHSYSHCINKLQCMVKTILSVKDISQCFPNKQLNNQYNILRTCIMRLLESRCKTFS